MSRRQPVILIVLLALSFAGAQPSAPVWTTAVGGPADTGDWASDCAVDNAGYLYATGMVNDGVSDNIFVVRYNATTGDTLSSLTYDNPGHTLDWGLGIAVDAGTNAVFVSGVVDTGPMQDMILIKMDALLADTVWTRRYDGSSGMADLGMRCAMDGPGVIYVAGISSNAGGGACGVLVKFNAATGDTVWTRRYTRPGCLENRAYACAVDPAHNVYFAGRSFNGTSFDLVTVKYNASGDTLWTRSDSTGMGLATEEYIYDDCAVDSLGSVYVAATRNGYTNPDTLSGDMMTVKYSAAGVRQWKSVYSHPAGSGTGWGCAFARSGILYAAGMGYWDDGSGDGGAMTTVAFNPATGDTLWSVRIHEGTGSSAAQGCAVDAAGDLYLSGFSWTSEAVKEDFYTVKYPTGGTTVAGSAVGQAMRAAPVLTAAVSAGKTVLSFAAMTGAAADGRVLRIYDSAGRLVRSFGSHELSGGRVTWDGATRSGNQAPAGLYYGHLRSADGSSTAVAFVRR